MTHKTLNFTMIQDIKCFSPEIADSYINYPDSGFDVTEHSAENGFWVQSRNRLFKKIVLAQVQLKNRVKLLEIGCGTGNFIQQICTENKLEITGSEAYLKGLHYAKKKIQTVEFVQFDVTKGVIDKEFDVVIAFDVIEHIDDDMAALSNIFDMLTDGGTFIVTVPQHKFLWSHLDEIVCHKRRYSRVELKNKLEQSGFTINYITSFVFILFPLMLLTRLLDQKKNGTDSNQPSDSELTKRVSFSRPVNWILGLFMQIDEALINARLSLPFGGTLVVIARKNKENH